jgi:hypothetical protein
VAVVGEVGAAEREEVVAVEERAREAVAVVATEVEVAEAVAAHLLPEVRRP